MYPRMHVTLTWYANCMFPTLPTWILIRVDALPLVFFSTMPSPSSSSWPEGRLSIPPLAGVLKAGARSASRCSGWGHVSDGVGVCHVRSSGGRISGCSRRVRERYGRHDSPCGVRSERLREEGDK
jgi:hypothetical protein